MFAEGGGERGGKIPRQGHRVLRSESTTGGGGARRPKRNAKAARHQHQASRIFGNGVSWGEFDMVKRSARAADEENF